MLLWPVGVFTGGDIEKMESPKEAEREAEGAQRVLLSGRYKEEPWGFHFLGSEIEEIFILFLKEKKCLKPQCYTTRQHPL